MPTDSETFQPGSRAIFTGDPFDGRRGKMTSAPVTITYYGGFEQVGFQVDGVEHAAMCTDSAYLIPCDENGRPLADEVERRFARFDQRQEALDAERSAFSALIAEALDR